MNPSDIKNRANSIRKCMTGEPYYDRKYKDLKVADLLLVLEDENYHSEETIIETIATLEYYDIIEACKIEVEREELSELPYEDNKRARLSEELHERQTKLNNKIRGKETLTN